MYAKSSSVKNSQVWPLIEQIGPFRNMTRKEFMDKFFDLCNDAQEKNPLNVIAEILRDYADRLH